MNLADYVRAVPGFPQPGVLFRDITPLLLNAEAFRYVLDALVEIAERADAESIVGIESRGFIFGTPIADRMGLPFVPVRKPGKLPAARMSVEYSLEYGESQLDIHEDAVARGQRCFIDGGSNHCHGLRLLLHGDANPFRAVFHVADGFADALVGVDRLAR